MNAAPSFVTEVTTSKVEVAPPTASCSRLLRGRIAVLDEQCRCGTLFGPVFERLGVEPVWAHGLNADAVMELKPALILLSMEWGTDMRLISAAARKAGIPTVYVVDGAMEWSYLWTNNTWIRPNGTNLQPLIASDLCVFGQHQARIFASMGMGSRIHVVGLPRLDAISRERVITTGAKPRIVVATSRTWAHDVEHKVMVLRGLRDLRDWFAKHREIDVVWRIGADLAEDLEVTPDIEGDVSSVLARATALISLPSTCLLEGMHKGLPVAQLEYRAVPLYTATAWEIRCASHIPSVIHELLYPPPQKLAFQDACFSDELELDDATGRLANVIRTAMERPDPFGDSGTLQPTRINGKLDFHQIYSELSTFAMDDHAVLQYELSAAYTALKDAKHAKQTFRNECINATEAFAGCDLRYARLYPFIERLSSCRAIAKGSGKAFGGPCTIEGRTTLVLHLHPPVDAGFVIPTGKAGHLKFAVSLHPDVWANPQSGPCKFVVQADGATVFDATIDQLTDPNDRKWWWFDVAIPEATSGTHQIVLSTRGVGGDAFRSGVWRSPNFVWMEADETTNDGCKLKIAGGANFYALGRTVA